MDKPAQQPFDWNDVYTGELSDVEEPDTQLMGAVAGLPAGRALDMGCGAGGTVLALAELGWEVTGVDIAPRAIQAASRLLASKGAAATLLVSDAVRFRPDGQFDLVLSSFALPATQEEQHTFYALAQSWLAPGGTILIKDFDASMKRIDVFDPFHCPDVPELRGAFGGMEIVSCEIVTTRRGGHDDTPWTAVFLHAQS